MSDETESQSGYFADNELYQVYVDGSGETIYYPDDQGVIIGANKATGSNIRIKIKERKVTDITFINKPEGYEANPVTQSLTVLVRGTQETLDAVTASQIRIVADLARLDLSTGTRTVPVRVYLDGSSDVGVVGEYNISISISRS